MYGGVRGARKTPSTRLTWSHLRLLFNLEIDSINYYIQVIIEKHLSVRELEFNMLATGLKSMDFSP